MFALGQKQTSEDVQAMPALPPKADFRQRSGLSEFQEFDRFPRAYAATGIPIRPSLGRTSREHHVSGAPASLAPPTRDSAECRVDLFHMAKIDIALV